MSTLVNHTQVITNHNFYNYRAIFMIFFSFNRISVTMASFLNAWLTLPHSERSESTGFVSAARIACQLIVKILSSNASTPAPRNTLVPTFV